MLVAGRVELGLAQKHGATAAPVGGTVATGAGKFGEMAESLDVGVLTRGTD